MKIDYKNGIILNRNGEISLDEARTLIGKQYPHIVNAHIVRSSAKDGSIHLSVDWRSVFGKPEIKLFITSKIK